MSTLHDELRGLAPAVEWPATPDLAGAVAERLEAAPTRPEPRRPSRRRRAAVAVGVVLALGGGTLAVSPDARSALRDLLGLGGVRIERREPRPGLGRDLDLGTPTSLAAARRAVDFPLLVPDEGSFSVYLDPSVAGGGAVTFVSSDGRTLVTQVSGEVGPVIGKAAGHGTAVIPLTVDGQRAYWLAGAHEFGYLDATGSFVSETTRLAGPVLLVETSAGVLVRIEGAGSRHGAVMLMRSLQG